MTDRWPQVPLGALLSKTEERVVIRPDQAYRQITVRLWGEGVVLRNEVSGMEIKAKTRYVAREGQFILSRIDARNGAFGLVPASLDGAVVSNDFPTFKINKELLEPRFLEWMSKTKKFVDLCRAASEGTTNRVRLQVDRFLVTEIPLPPLAEQRRIVARIEELAAKVEAARALREVAMEEAEALWHSSLDAAFRPSDFSDSADENTASTLLTKQAQAYRQVPNPKHNRAHPGNPNIYADGPYDLPLTWVWTDLGSVLTHLVDCVNDTPDFATSPTGLLGLKSTNVRPYELDLSERWFMTSDDFEWWNRREAPQAGDIVLTREAPMGNACILPKDVQACLTQRLMLLRTDTEFVETRYLLHYINSPHFQNQVLDVCRGLTTPHIRVKDAPLIKIPLASCSEQRRIVAHLDDLQAKVDAVKQHQAATAAALDALLPSILDRAFRGELVEQDPADEPASALLERIRET